MVDAVTVEPAEGEPVGKGPPVLDPADGKALGMVDTCYRRSRYFSSRFCTRRQKS